MQTKNQVIAFIGAGHMGGALIGGLIASGHKPAHIWASCPSNLHLKPLQENYGIYTTHDNVECASHAEVLILAVTPQKIPRVLAEISAQVTQTKPLIISIAAGVEAETLQKALGGQLEIIRAMPNTPALIRYGATALYANAAVSAKHKLLAEVIFNAVGTCVWLDHEQEMFTATALSGSGPAYFFLLIQALEEVAAQLGLPAAIANPLLLQTAVGSAHMAMACQQNAAALAKQAASPGGGTEQALKVLEDLGFREIIGKAVTAAKKRYEELAEMGNA